MGSGLHRRGGKCDQIDGIGWENRDLRLREWDKVLLRIFFRLDFQSSSICFSWVYAPTFS